MEIAVVGREIVEKSRGEEGGEVVLALLNDCVRVDVEVRIQEGDAWIGNFDGDMHGWVANGGGNDFPGPLRTRWGISKGEGGWVQKIVGG